MAAADAAWYRMSSRMSPSDIVAMLCFDGDIDLEQLKARIRAGLRVHDRFRQRVVDRRLGLPILRWEEEPESAADSHFDVRSIAVPGGDDALRNAVNDIVNEPFDWNASPWRVYLLEGYARGSVAVARLHHCMGDGFALVRVVLSLADEKDVSTAKPAGTPSARGVPENRVLGWARRAPRALVSLSRLLTLSFDPETPFRGSLCGRRHMAWSQPIELRRIRELARARHVTINDILTTVATGAFRTYLESQTERLRPFRAIMPVNLRPPHAAQETVGNWFGLVFVELPIDEPDRDHRLGAVKADIDRIKASEEALVSLAMLDLMGRLPRRIERVVHSVLARKGTVVLSNVIGPLEPFHMLGHRASDLVFWPPHPGALACGVGILSYAGTIRFSVRSDVAVIYDPERIAELFERELAMFERKSHVERAEDSVRSSA
jgi:diacylglycerol O-acyltransferase